MKYTILTKDYPIGMAEEELGTLGDDAINNYLSDTDFDVRDWLAPEDLKKYCELSNYLGSSDICICTEHEE